MSNSTLTAKRIFLNMCLGMIAALACSVIILARPQDPSARQRALELYEANNLAAALPLLERVAAANPNDPAVLSRLGFALYANSVDVKDPAQRQKMRERARTTLLHSQSLGDNSNFDAHGSRRPFGAGWHSGSFFEYQSGRTCHSRRRSG